MWYTDGHEVSPRVVAEVNNLTFLSSHKNAFFSEDFTWQTKMMDAMLTGLERSLVGFT
jgi:hypothetical protein